MASSPRRTRLVLLGVVAVAATLALVAVQSLPSLAKSPIMLSELSEGPVATVKNSEENIVGSLGMEPANARATDGGLLASADLIADGETPAAEPVTEEQESAADATEYADAGEEKEGVVPVQFQAAQHGGETNFHQAASAEDDLNSYFDNLPVRDVTPDHLPKGAKEVVTRDGQRELSRGRAVSNSEDSRFNNEPNSGSEWEDKMNNLDEAIHLFRTKGDEALETAVKEGLTKQPYQPGQAAFAQTPADKELEQERAIPRDLTRRLATSTGNKMGGVDGLRAVQYKKLLDTVKGSLSKERQIMAKLGQDVAAKKAEQGCCQGRQHAGACCRGAEHVGGCQGCHRKVHGQDSRYEPGWL